MQKKETNIQKKWKSTMTLRENRDLMVNFFFYFTLLDFQIKLIDWFRNEEKKLIWHRQSSSSSSSVTANRAHTYKKKTNRSD